MQPRQVLLVAVLVAAVGVTACARSDGTAGADTTTMSSWHASEVPLATALPAPPPSESRSPSPSSATVSDAEPIRPPGPATMPAAAPVRVQIPSIGVDSTLIDLGLQADGTLEVPPSGFPAGWYTGSPTPGERGPAIIAGHVDWAGQPGVFFELRDLASGDEIVIGRGDGSTAPFRVTRVERFDKDEFPTEAVYGDLDHAGLRLITCGGAFDRQARSYQDNIIVFAELIGGETQ
ncbi:MAG: class F sortase [Nitriliruptoraceae bacterium]